MLATTVSRSRSPTDTAASICFDTDPTGKYDGLAPRYTSYPVADRFIKTYHATSDRNTLEQRSITRDPAAYRNVQLLSLYVHIPFCDTVCYLRNGNKLTSRNHVRAARYLSYLET